MAISPGKLAPSAVVMAFVGYCIWPSVSELASEKQQSKPPEKAAELASSLFSPKLPPPPTRNPFGGRDAAALAAAKEAKESPNAGEASSGKSVDPLATLKLNATCICGKQRLAIINGQLYAPQERLASENSSVSPYKVAAVLPYKVLLEGEGKTVELTYYDVVPRPAASPQTNADGKPAATPPAPSASKEPAAAAGDKSGVDKQPSKAGN